MRKCKLKLTYADMIILMAVCASIAEKGFSSGDRFGKLLSAAGAEMGLRFAQKTIVQFHKPRTMSFTISHSIALSSIIVLEKPDDNALVHASLSAIQLQLDPQLP